MDNIQQNIQENLKPENLEENADRVREGFEAAHKREEETVGNAKESFQENVATKFPVPTPPSGVTGGSATAHELKVRLNWGEPGLTILDVRSHAAYDDCRILGALNMPMAELTDTAHFSLQPNRDIYVYADSDEDAASAAGMLRDAGFTRVAMLKGGLKDWKAIGGPIDGAETNVEPSAGAYNVVSRLKEFAEERSREKSMH
jgi:rhodanese-related sulfurtransferase